ncbi:MAG TPA: glycosyltransferase family 1 protein [Actinomycetota bacterium]|nr:glycosyltransferase family 1 protein [Actinomycetota bacterium]
MPVIAAPGGRAPEPSRCGPVFLDLQAIQSRDYAERGVARHAYEFALALHASRPDLLGAILLNPELPVPPRIEALVSTGRLRFSHVVDPSPCRIYHVIAPFELEQHLERIWPARLAGAALVVTLHDLIPRVYPGHYHADPGLRRRYLAREELVRAAERVLSVSETTRREAIERLAIEPDRVRVIGAGISSAFRPAGSGAPAGFERAREVVPGLRPGFLLYVGGEDHRKNIDGLLAGYALLAPELRAQHPLVVACRLSEAARARVLEAARDLSIGDRVLLTGYVEDPALIALYRATELFVFPSRYEGYGLPVAEAMACGAPTVAANTSATAELAPPAGWFDPEDPADIARAITAGLTDPATRAALIEASGAAPPTWSQAAARAAAVYEELLGRPAPPARTLRVGVVGSPPLPPAIARLDRPGIEVDTFLDTREGAHRVEAARGGYDVMVYVLGEPGAALAARARPGIVMAPDVTMARELIASSLAYLTPSAPMAARARLEASPGQEGRVGVADELPQRVGDCARRTV